MKGAGAALARCFTGTCVYAPDKAALWIQVLGRPLRSRVSAREVARLKRYNHNLNMHIEDILYSVRREGTGPVLALEAVAFVDTY